MLYMCICMLHARQLLRTCEQPQGLVSRFNLTKTVLQQAAQAAQAECSVPAGQTSSAASASAFFCCLAASLQVFQASFRAAKAYNSLCNQAEISTYT